MTSITQNDISYSFNFETERILRNKKTEEKIPLVIVGNKMDLENERRMPQSVYTESLKKLDKEKFNGELIFTSAKENQNVTELFQLITKMMRKNGSKNATNKKKCFIF